jgi:hypothetical protein
MYQPPTPIYPSCQVFRVPRFLFKTNSIVAWRGGAELGGGRFDVALPVLAGEHRAATLTPVGCRRGEPR